MTSEITKSEPKSQGDQEIDPPGLPPRPPGPKKPDPKEKVAGKVITRSEKKLIPGVYTSNVELDYQYYLPGDIFPEEIKNIIPNGQLDKQVVRKTEDSEMILTINKNNTFSLRIRPIFSNPINGNNFSEDYIVHGNYQSLNGGNMFSLTGVGVWKFINADFLRFLPSGTKVNYNVTIYAELDASDHTIKYYQESGFLQKTINNTSIPYTAIIRDNKQINF